MNLSIDYEKISESISNKRFLKRLIIGTALVTNLLPLFSKDLLNTNAKLLLASTGLVSAIACCKLPDSSHEEKLDKTYKETSLKQYKLTLQGEILKTQTELEIGNQQSLANTIERVPEHQIDYFAQKYGVAPLLAKYYIDGEDEKVENVGKTAEEIGTVAVPTIYYPQSPSSEWLDTFVYEYTLPQGKRLHEHLMINGSTQSGKSTLISALLGKIINVYSRQNKPVALNLIDPKYPMTTWLWEPTYTGFEEVVEGVNQAIKELENRKKMCKEAKQNKEELPQFNPYLMVLDEWDICYGNGKGYGSTIDKSDAQTLLASVKRIISEGAAYDVRLVLIGQSPLSGDNGLNRSVAKQTSRLVVGMAGLSWLQDPGFPFKNDLSQLIGEITPMIEEEKRSVLICPNRGKVKVFEIPDIQILKPDTVPQDTPQQPTNYQDSFDKIKVWCVACFEEHGKYPTNAEIKIGWHRLTGVELTDEALELLVNKLNLV